MSAQYRIVLVDTYYDRSRTETVEAESLDEAIDLAMGMANDEQLHLDEVAADDGEVACFGSPAYEVVNATGLLRRGLSYVEDTVPSLTFDMALDLLELMHPDAEVVAIRAGFTTSYLRSSSSEPSLPPTWRH